MRIDRSRATSLGPHTVAVERPRETIIVESHIDDLIDPVLRFRIVDPDQGLHATVEVAAHEIGRPDVGDSLARAIAIEEGISVQQVEYGRLKPVLLKSGQKL